MHNYSSHFYTIEAELKVLNYTGSHTVLNILSPESVWKHSGIILLNHGYMDRNEQDIPPNPGLIIPFSVSS